MVVKNIACFLEKGEIFIYHFKKGMFMKKLIIGSILSVATASMSFAGDVNFYGGASEDEAFNWSSTTTNAPWGSAVTDWASTVALWKGVSGQTYTPGYVNIDGACSINAFKISGTNGKGSDLNLMFSKDNNSSLTIESGTLINLNNHYVNLNFNGDGTVQRTGTLGISLTTTSEEKASVNFDKGIALNVTGAVSMEGKGSAYSTVNINGAYSSGEYTTIKNIVLNFSGASAKTITGDFDVNGDSIVTLKNNATLDVAKSFTVKDSSSATVEVGSTLNASGTALTVGSKTDGSAVASFTVSGTVDATNATFNSIGFTNIDINNGAKVNVASVNYMFADQATLSVDGNGVGATVNINGEMNVTGAFNTHSYNKITVGSTGKLTVGGILNISGNAPLANNDKSVISVVINSAGNSVGNVFMAEYGGFRVNADNDWSGASVLLRGGRTTIEVGNGATLELNSLLSVAEVSGKTTTLKVEAGSKLILSSINGNGVSGSNTFVGYGQLADGNSNMLNILNFEEGTILFRALGTDEENANFLSHVKLDGAINADLHFSSFDASAGGYWLTLVSIPEPAEWAAIFGAIALAMAIYRRRK